MKYILLWIILLFSLQLYGQEYNYIHYDTRDGLAGSTVYKMCQDKEGYMWFATDNGVSRFDGKNFTNFTTEDGLTDNEVLFIANDSKGRVWMMPFNKTVCYYYKGKIYSADNDSVLKKVRFSSNGIMAGENSNKEIYFIVGQEIFILKKSGEIKVIANFNELAKKYSLNPADFVPANLSDQYPYTMVLYNKHSVFINKGDSFEYVKQIKSNPSERRHFYKVDESLEVLYPVASSGFLNSFNSKTPINQTPEFFNTSNGAWAIDKNGYVSAPPFLPGKRITYSFRDTEGNTWFSTIGEGVYRVSTISMKTFVSRREAFCIDNANGKIYAGLADGTLQIIKDLVFEKEYPSEFFKVEPESRRLYTLKSDMSGSVYLGFDSHLAKLNKDKTITSPIRPIKSIDIVDKHSIVVCTNYFTLKLRSSDLTVIDTIWRDRGTKVVYDKGYYYIGTLNGLVVIDSAKNVTQTASGIPLLSNRVVDMVKSGSGGLWVATNSSGVVLYNMGRVETVINMANGLSSNICKSVFLNEKYLWVGTNKGINKVDLLLNRVVAKYSTSDGLGSDIINSIYCEKDVIWVASPAGLTHFKEKDISDSSICQLDLHSVYVSGKKMDSIHNLKLAYKHNNISFSYDAISFKSAGAIVYKYRLNGLDDDWNETKLTTLAYPSLPSGEYELQLYAVNKFGKNSNIIHIPFYIEVPFWKTIWFWALLGLLFLAGFWYLLSRRYKRMQERMKERSRIKTRITELEQASLRAQMNPHFIFNCLNSIQHYVLKNDLEQTNGYITQFGNLIRQTLDNSARANISITEEITYLTSYLELERIRFSPAFQFEVHLSPSIHADYTFIPSMLMQPFVENAIRHGIRHKKDGTGKIKINISQKAGGIEFCIEDNGIGREAALLYKSEQHIEYQSKGINLTQNRIEILNLSGDKKILFSIDDVRNEKGNASGTKVVIFFPDSIIGKFN